MIDLDGIDPGVAGMPRQEAPSERFAKRVLRVERAIEARIPADEAIELGKQAARQCEPKAARRIHAEQLVRFERAAMRQRFELLRDRFHPLRSRRPPQGIELADLAIDRLDALEPRRRTT